MDPIKSAKSFVRTVVSGFDTLQVIANTGKTGVSVYAVHTVRSAPKVVTSRTRGASSTHPTLALAIAAVNATIATALTDGWSSPATKGGRRAAPDSFTLSSLPKPRAAATKVVSGTNSVSPSAKTANKSVTQDASIKPANKPASAAPAK